METQRPRLIQVSAWVSSPLTSMNLWTEMTCTWSFLMVKPWTKYLATWPKVVPRHLKPASTPKTWRSTHLSPLREVEVDSREVSPLLWEWPSSRTTLPPPTLAVSCTDLTAWATRLSLSLRLSQERHTKQLPTSLRQWRGCWRILKQRPTTGCGKRNCSTFLVSANSRSLPECSCRLVLFLVARLATSLLEKCKAGFSKFDDAKWMGFFIYFSSREAFRFFLVFESG